MYKGTTETRGSRRWRSARKGAEAALALQTERTIRAENALAIIRPALKWCGNHAPTPDPHGIAGHARAGIVAYDRIMAGHTNTPPPDGYGEERASFAILIEFVAKARASHAAKNDALDAIDKLQSRLGKG